MWQIQHTYMLDMVVSFKHICYCGGKFIRFCGGSMKLTLTPPVQQTMFSFVAKGLKLRLTRIFSNLPLFIRVFAWSIVDTFLSRPLGEQFVLGLKEGMKRNKDSSRKDVIKHRKNLRKISRNKKLEQIDLEDNPPLHKVEEEWNKGSKDDSNLIGSHVGKSFQKSP